ncbi:hypothetical protein [Kribbella sindirgiensis]|uniref:Uncharacterized protein n=1 Tax=Kribbella sindirgiensis TaxID=1124744 RepID=A0A4R0I1D2_9ACTN|nr:hypothetical protein [Kribbella sindirgiensis]TCC19259.1 hypothetical protein E0H50_38160 [Kribbella sindirgiensis]
MADSDEIFLALDEPLEVAAERVARVLELEFNGDLRAETGELQYKVRARTSDGVVGVYIGPNTFEPEPDEVQAMDGYAVVVDVQYRTRKDAQAEEARLMFERLVDALSDVPALLSHNVEVLVAASLPGRGTHTFDPGTTVDDPDLSTWEPWVARR